MNLIEFIKYIKDEEEAIQYMNEHYPDVDYYEAEVYLKGSLSVESELAIFDGEKIEGMIEMEVDNEKYYNLFTLDLLVEVYGDYSKSSGTDREIAERMITYRIKDA
ncbi:MAG: hypothetical protein R2792_20015 [Saprospiraceae bacterium]